jgi:hypothetical protein
LLFSADDLQPRCAEPIASWFTLKCRDEVMFPVRRRRRLRVACTAPPVPSSMWDDDDATWGTHVSDEEYDAAAAQA